MSAKPPRETTFSVIRKIGPNWSHQSAIRFGKMALKRCAEIVASAQAGRSFSVRDEIAGRVFGQMASKGVDRQTPNRNPFSMPRIGSD